LILAWVPSVQTRSEGLSATYSMHTGGFSPPIKWVVRGSAAGLYIMPRLRASGAVTCGHGVHRAILCVPVAHSSGLVRSKDAVKLTVAHAETK